MLAGTQIINLKEFKDWVGQTLNELKVAYYSRTGISNVLVSLYNQDWRHYHGLSHIVEMFNVSGQLGWKLSLSEKIAILFHDSIYDPSQGPGWSAEQSVQLMRVLLPISTEYKIIQAINEAESIILATQDLTRENFINQSQAHRVLDLDYYFLLKGLSNANEKVQQEAKVLYPRLGEKEFIKNRLDVLAKIREGKIFLSSDLGNRIEEARENIRLEEIRLKETYDAL